MKLHNVLVIFLFFSGVLHLNGQDLYPRDYFRSPLTVPMLLSGTFSELRSNHFHSGIDIKTQGKTGLPVIAIADAYVSRIKVSPYGYGNVLYLTHPNGYTSVYGHLSKFEKTLADYVKDRQYAIESFEIELYPLQGQFVFKKGDTIGYSGNSGSSQGPHLHFEIRNTMSEWIINPLHFGLNVYDKISPRINGLKLQALDKETRIEVVYYGKKSNYTKTYLDEVKFGVVKYNGYYKLSGVKEVRVNGNVGIAIETWDQMNGSSSKLGIYNIRLFKQGRPVFEQERNTFAFDQTRFINAHVDYAELLRSKKRYQRLYTLPYNELPFYTINEGFSSPNQDDTLDYVIDVSDFYNNKSELRFQLIGAGVAGGSEQNKDTLVRTVFRYDKENRFEANGIQVYSSPYSFYNDFGFKYQVKDAPKGAYSDIHYVHMDETPVHKAYTLKINVPGFPKELQDKALIAEYNNGRFKSEGGNYKNGQVVCRLKEFGAFCVAVDTVKPFIRLVNFKNGSVLSSATSLQIKIVDKLSGIKSYRATIDGHWILMEYDAKNDLLIHNFDERTAKGEHILKLVVTDEKDNVSQVEVKFRR